ncbi:MAG: hypothetical protein STSR0004_19220 [Peptococcaceae bacterium]
MSNTVGFIGFGSMGSLLVNGFLSANAIDEKNTFISTRTKQKLGELKRKYPKVNICETNTELASKCKYIFICVKPLEVMDVLFEIKNSLFNDVHIISMRMPKIW